MTVHRVLTTIIPDSSAVVTIEGDEGHHAVSVKRVRVGEVVELMDGRGMIGTASVVEAEQRRGKRPDTLRVLVQAVRKVDPARPAVHVYAPAPKGDRLAWMIDQLSQVGAASWSPLRCERAVAGNGEGKAERLHRVAVESMKQCGRAWCLQLRPALDVGQAINATGDGPICLADVSGGPAHSAIHADRPSLRLFVGPEGGLTAAELDALARAGAVTVCLGPHVMRIETAAVAGAVAMLGGRRS